MKNSLLSINVFTKIFALFVMMQISYNGLAQDCTINVGKGKIYGMCWGINCCYIANIISSKENQFAKQVIADRITYFITDGDQSWTYDFISSYGNFVEVQFSETVSTPKMIVNTEESGADLFYIVYNGSKLSLVKRNTERSWDNEILLRTLLTDFNMSDDFQIFFSFSYKSKNPIIRIINNGLMYYYYINKGTSIRSPEVDKIESKTYSLEGKQVESPKEGIFIKGGKKVVIK